MSYDDPEYDLLAAFQQRFGLGKADESASRELPVLSSAQFVYDNAIDVSVSMAGTKAAAARIWDLMRRKEYSTASWAAHELHPKDKSEDTVAFIFTLDLLNFCFWSELDATERYAVEYRGRRWTGYWGLVAALRRALDAGLPITDPHWWQDGNECTADALAHVFRSATAEPMPLLAERAACLREAGRVLYEKFDCSFLNVLKKADRSAVALVNLVAADFPTFRDECRWEGRRVHFLKRAQILAADLWACFEGEGWGAFDDVAALTAFPDYRIPQVLHALGVLHYSPPLESRVRRRLPIAHADDYEVQLRGCAVWAVELLRREILAAEPKAKLNAVLLDFFLYDTVKEMEAAGNELIPHHRTRSIWY